MINTNELTMLVDYSLCIGCEACTAVCKQIYNVSPNIYRTKINERSTGKYYSGISDGKMRKVFLKNACLHCKEASCVMACPTGACHKNEDGLVVIDERLCISCNYCAKNCPYNAISYDKENGKVEKCTLCAERIGEGLEPLCSTVCPTKAIRFGTRNEILDHARNRVKDLKKQGYVNANLYGDCQLGGQKVITILDEEPKAYGLPADPQIPIMLRVWNAAPMRPIALLTAGVIIGFNFLHSRKYGKKTEEVRKKHDKAPYCHVPPGQDEDDDLEAMDKKDK
ncbi:4Fe-4S dicluster domain-containing protein [Schnuerera sp.]|uniref:4Fe-4S dicluster domain-containing protein n=1 Tax=Schnuerera sp. TaxID=2794844 RepID=UPI002CB54E96|nr:4Fe-4S dicluster domain-containing protein [Schnuerera sp.]HSH36394.1 4Fe-4S dicluster domain-containing protein [Schnuerera sp.]